MKIEAVNFPAGFEFEGEVGSWGLGDDDETVECEVTLGAGEVGPWVRLTLTLEEAMMLGSQAFAVLARRERKS